MARISANQTKTILEQLTSKRKKKEMTGVPRFEQSQNVERGYAAMPMCLPQVSSPLNKMNDTVL